MSYLTMVQGQIRCPPGKTCTETGQDHVSQFGARQFGGNGQRNGRRTCITVSVKAIRDPFGRVLQSLHDEIRHEFIGLMKDQMPDLGKVCPRSFTDLPDTSWNSPHYEIENCHSTSKEAAEIAKEANVKLLVLTHISTRYTTDVNIKDEAKEIFENTVVANDFTEINIGKDKTTINFRNILTVNNE